MQSYSEMNKTSKVIKTRYITALAIIAFLVISSHFIMEFSSKKAEFDSRIINIAGRQRMLSQKITKCVFGISISKNDEIRKGYIEELEKALVLWKKSHYGLQKGDDSLGLPGKNTQIVTDLFNSIEINFETMIKTTDEVLLIVKNNNYDNGEIEKRLLLMRENEKVFLPVMDKIVFQYDSEAKAKVMFNQIINLVLGLLTLLTLALEARFIFMPMTKEVEESIKEIEDREAKLKEAVKELETGEKIIRQKNEELIEANTKIMDSISVAKLIQDSILPEILFEEKNDLKIEYNIIWKPRDIVGGDFYWRKTIGDIDFFAVVDCTGHGVPGAMMTMMIKTALDQIVENKNVLMPSEIIENLNDFIRKALNKTESKAKADVGADIGILSVDTKMRKIVFSGAKINLFKIKYGSAEIVKGDKQSVGYKKIKENFKYTDFEFDLDEREILYISSDGYVDQNGGNEDRSFGTKRFTMLLESISTMEIDEQKKTLEEVLTGHMNGEKQRDDITVFGMRFKKV